MAQEPIQILAPVCCCDSIEWHGDLSLLWRSCKAAYWFLELQSRSKKQNTIKEVPDLGSLDFWVILTLSGEDNEHTDPSPSLRSITRDENSVDCH